MDVFSKRALDREITAAWRCPLFLLGQSGYGSRCSAEPLVTQTTGGSLDGRTNPSTPVRRLDRLVV
jgi:hypothetical protein